jgi:hypothetical protein
MGYANLAPAYSDLTAGLMTVIAEYGLKIPTIGSINTSVGLTSSEVWPDYTRTIVSDRYNARAIPQMFEKFGWTQCALLYYGDSWG